MCLFTSPKIRGRCEWIQQLRNEKTGKCAYNCRTQVKVIAIKHGDRFLLASDGLHDMVTVADIEMILNGSREPEPSARQLVAAALKNGGRDNITVIVVDL